MPELLDNNNRLHNSIIYANYKRNNGEITSGIVPDLFNTITDEYKVISNEMGKYQAKKLLINKYPNLIKRNNLQYEIDGKQI